MTDSAEPSRVQIAPGAWAGGVEIPEFKALIDAKRRAIVPMIIIFVVGYMGLSALAGFARGLLGMKVWGAVNLGFALIAGNYVMAWLLAVIYARISTNSHDPLVKIVVEKVRGSGDPQ